MTNVTHASLTGSDLHEPKGVSTAAINTVYVANGSGSGTWADASSIITNSAWTTGDTKLTFQASAPASWILFAEGGTIGDGSSGGTVRANTDCQALYELFWGAFSNTICPVSSGRGATATADWASHKSLQLPPMASRALGVVGSGTGLTTRALGDTVGAETTTLKQSDLPNVHQTVAINDPGHTHAINPSAPYIGTYSGDVSLNNVAAPLGQAELTIYSAYTGISASFYLNGNVTQTIPTNMSPTVFLNLLIKL